MCLYTIDKKTKDFTYGWKVFRKSYGKLRGQYYTRYGFLMEGYSVNEWIKDTAVGSIYAYIKPYKKGFHFYKTREDARKSRSHKGQVIRKVLVKDIVASGTQGGKIAGVAKKMKILTDKT